jgi:putative membrane protein
MNMDKIIILFKGFIIGIGKIIPGVSGSLIALNLGLYEKIINSISNFFKDVKNNIYFLSNVGIGMLIAIVLGSKLLNYLLSNYYFITIITFIGLLIGSNINFFKHMKTKKEYVLTIITFILMLSLFFIKTNVVYIYKNNLLNNFYIFILGFIDAATTIIPSISGTVIFMILGSYEFILSIFSNPFSNIKITFLFFIGLFIGIILISKLMDNLLKNKKNIIYPIINGFFLSSILFLLIESFTKIDNLLEINLFFPIIIISYKIGKLFN